MNFKVYTIPHTLFAAQHLVQQIKKLRHRCQLVTKIENDDAIYIIYNPAVIRGKLPKKYIVYQTEIGTSRWFSPHYFRIIENALAVWDYSPVNVVRYREHNKKITIVPPGINPQPVIDKDIAVLFYGYNPHGHRRSNILSQIQRHVPVHIETNLMGEAMWKKLAHAKVVVNVHFYDNSPFELFRVNEALSHSCHVVSEAPVNNQYRQYVQFGMSASEIAARIKDCLKIPFAVNTTGLNNLADIRAGIALVKK